MKIKTFHARSMNEALRSIKAEFGGEALILSSKESSRRPPLGFWSKGGVEVVAATDVDESGDFRAAPAGPEGSHRGTDVYAPGSPGNQAGSCRDGLGTGGEYNEMRRAFCSQARPAGRANALFPDIAACELYQGLVANEVNEWLAFRLLDEAQKNLPVEERRQREVLIRSVAEVAGGLIRVAPTEDGLPGKKVVAFVGPTGVGKTTAIAKLGASLALEKKKRVALLTTDSCRIGAAEQLRTYAALIGLPFRAVEEVSDLSSAIREQSRRDYVLIDTAGRCQRDLDAVRDLMRFLQNSPDIERHLVVSATTKTVDLQEIVDRFGVCNPDSLLFTKLDETSTFGPIFNELVRSRKSLSYIADGQRIPEDLHAVQRDQFIDIVLNHH